MVFYIILVLFILLIYYMAQTAGKEEKKGGNDSDKPQIAFAHKPTPDSVVIFRGFWTRADVEKNPRWLFIYGDNDIHKGTGGQAIIRGARNAYGVPTKKLPSLTPRSFYNDEEFEANSEKIDNALQKIQQAFHRDGYLKIVLPEKGLGTGLAQLDKRAPRTFEYLQEGIEQLITDISAPT